MALCVKWVKKVFDLQIMGNLFFAQVDILVELLWGWICFNYFVHKFRVRLILHCITSHALNHFGWGWGGVGWGGVGCIYIYTSFEMLPFEKNTWNIYIFCFLIKKCFFFYVYNNNELCNMPHEYGRQLRYQWLHISITFVQNL